MNAGDRTREEPKLDERSTLSIRWMTDGYGPGASGKPDGRIRLADIQGRPVYLLLGGTQVLVKGYHGGDLLVSTMVGRMSLGYRLGNFDGLRPHSEEELVKVAEGVRWLG